MRSTVNAEVPLSCEVCPVGRYAIYAPAFPGAPQSITARRHAQSQVAARRTILREDEVPRNVYTLFSSWAYRYKSLPDGGCQILSFYIPGDFLSVQAMTGEPLPFSVKALTDAVLCAFDRETFFGFLKESEALRDSLCRDVLGQYDEADRQLVGIGRRPAIARIAGFLLALEARLRRRGLSREGRFELPIPQGLIADSLGLTAVHVNRTMAAIRESGAIEFRRNEMHIRDFEELGDLAEGR